MLFLVFSDNKTWVWSQRNAKEKSLFSRKWKNDWEREGKSDLVGIMESFPGTQREFTWQVMTRLRMIRESWIAKRSICTLKNHWSSIPPPRMEKKWEKKEALSELACFSFYWRRWILKCYNQERDEFWGDDRMHI